MDFTIDNAIFVSDKAKEKVLALMDEAGKAAPEYFLRVGVVGGGCSGLSYKMDFDNESKPNDQVFEHNGLKIVTDMKSSLYLVNTTLEFSDGLNGKGELRAIINFGHRTGNGALEALAQKKLDAAYANETDPVIRNLGAVLNQVLTSAHDLNDRLHSFRKRKVHAKRWAGDAWASSLELPGALETILTEFLKNSQYNYYYWTSYIDEEKKANLQGRLRARYLKIGDELRSLFPQAKTRFRYNDPNYLEMVLDDTVTIVLSYYYREGDKDIISLSVDAQYPK